MKPKSPTHALVTKAFLPATAAELRWNQNDTSRYEQRPTPSQPRNVTRKLDPSTSTSIDAAEQVHEREEAAEVLVAVHVAERVDVDQRPDAGHKENERDRERIGEKPHLHLEPAGREPREEVDECASAAPRLAAPPASRPTIRTTAPSGRWRATRAWLTEAPAEQQQERRAEGKEAGTIETRSQVAGVPSALEHRTSSAMAPRRRRTRP